MPETLTYTLVACGVLFLVLPVMIHVYAKMATLGFYAGRSEYRNKVIRRATQIPNFKLPTEPGDN